MEVMEMRTPIRIFIFLLLILSFSTNIFGFNYSTYDYDPVNYDTTKMTNYELVNEMKYIIEQRNKGNFISQDRVNKIEKQLATNQQAEIDRFKKQLKNDAEMAKKVEEYKQKAIDKAKEKGNEYYEKNKDKIQEKVEDYTRRTFKISKDKWTEHKDKFNNMYKEGKEYYEQNVKDYVEYAEKAYSAYKAYNKAKTDHPYAPDSAQKLVGFLNATSEVLDFAGSKMEKSPLRPIGEILKGYGQAAKLGDTAAKKAWAAIHKDGEISNYHKTQFTKGLSEIGGIITSSYSALNTYDKSITVLKLDNGNYAAFDKDFKLIPGANGKSLTPAEYKKMEQLYTAFSKGKDKSWPKLTTEELVKLAKGEKIKFKTTKNWIFKDSTKDLTADSVIKKANTVISREQKEMLLKSLDRVINGERGIFGTAFDLLPLVERNRQKEIKKLFQEYKKEMEKLENTDSLSDINSDIHYMEKFLEMVKKLKGDKKKLTPEEIKKAIEEEKNKSVKKPEGDKDKNKDNKKKKDNPLEEKLKKLDKNINKVDSSGVKKKDESLLDKLWHWVFGNKDEFSGNQDAGFTKIGQTHRELPDPNAMQIPVLKPNIYIYNGKNENIDVVFKNPEKLLVSIPEYKTGWSIISLDNGLFYEESGAIYYDYLFYEADINTRYFQTSTGWNLYTDKRISMFNKILDDYGFNKKEKDDFIEFWKEKLDKTTDYYMYPQETAIINRAMTVSINPEPENVHRIWFYFIPMEEDEEIFEPLKVEKIVHEGYTVTEWGGMVK
jgi:hypothetical protein